MAPYSKLALETRLREIFRAIELDSPYAQIADQLIEIGAPLAAVTMVETAKDGTVAALQRAVDALEAQVDMSVDGAEYAKLVGLSMTTMVSFETLKRLDLVVAADSPLRAGMACSQVQDLPVEYQMLRAAADPAFTTAADAGWENFCRTNYPADDAELDVEYGESLALMSTLWLKSAPSQIMAIPALMCAARLLPAMAMSAAVRHAKMLVRFDGCGTPYDPPVGELAHNLAEWLAERLVGKPSAISLPPIVI